MECLQKKVEVKVDIKSPKETETIVVNLPKDINLSVGTWEVSLDYSLVQTSTERQSNTIYDITTSLVTGTSIKLEAVNEAAAVTKDYAVLGHIFYNPNQSGMPFVKFERHNSQFFLVETADTAQTDTFCVFLQETELLRTNPATENSFQLKLGFLFRQIVQ
jgi:hypothetical protein